MNADASIMKKDLLAASGLGATAKEWGLGAVWCAEPDADGFLRASKAGRSTESTVVRTAITVVSARNPMIVPFSAWKLADVSNESAFRNGWYFSGGRGSMDAADYLYVADHRSDLIISADTNICPPRPSTRW